MTTSERIQVGSMVRAPWRASFSRRGVVATVEQEICTILWERFDKNGWFWRRVSSSSSSSSWRDDEEDQEAQVALADVQLLQSFEERRNSSPQTNEIPLQRRAECKSHGDALLVKAKDPMAACGWYEELLHEGHVPQIGSTVVLRRNGGHLIAADVDCVEGGGGGDTSLDVTFTGVNKEAVEETVPLSDIWLHIWEDKDPQIPQDESASLLQIRILLNLARCTIQLSEISVTHFSNATAHEGGIMAVPEYRTAAIVACSLALTCIEHWRQGKQDKENSATAMDLEVKARLLRAGVYRHVVSKRKHALSDIQHVLQLRPNHKEATRLLQQCEASKQRQLRTNRKLARDVSAWVNDATTTTSPQKEDQKQAFLEGEESPKNRSLAQRGETTMRDSQTGNKNVGTSSTGAAGTSALFWGVTVMAIVVGALLVLRGNGNVETRESEDQWPW